MRLAVVLRTNRFFRTTTDRPSVRLTTGNRPRTFDNRNTLVRARSWINGVKSGHTSQAGYVLVGSGRKKGIQLVSAVLGTPSVAARDAATLAILDDSFGKFQTITAIRRGTVMTRVPIRYRRGAELALVAGRTVKRIVPRGQRDDVTRRVVGRPDDIDRTGRRAARASGRSRSSRTAAWWGACRSSRPPASRPRTSSRRRSPGSPARCRCCSWSP